MVCISEISITLFFAKSDAEVAHAKLLEEYLTRHFAGVLTVVVS